MASSETADEKEEEEREMGRGGTGGAELRPTKEEEPKPNQWNMDQFFCFPTSQSIPKASLKNPKASHLFIYFINSIFPINNLFSISNWIFLKRIPKESQRIPHLIYLFIPNLKYLF